MDENQLKNRSMNYLPRKLHTINHHKIIIKHDIIILSTADSSRVCITSEEIQSDYICANYIDVRILDIVYLM